MHRRVFLRNAGIASASVSMLPVVANALPMVHAADASDSLADAGVGIYTDMSVASQISTFTITPVMVTCGVGLLATPSVGPLAATTGPFAMLMYSLSIKSYDIDRAAGVIRATGRMRSVTRLLGMTHEDVDHEFLAIGQDYRGAALDRFDVHFLTPFWNPGNPMATKSTEVPGWVRFGGQIVGDNRGAPMGDVNVLS